MTIFDVAYKQSRTLFNIARYSVYEALLGHKTRIVHCFFVVIFLSHSRQSNRSKWLREREYRRTLPYRSRCFPISIQHMAGCVCVQKPYWPFKINDFCLVFWLLLSLKMFSSMLSCVRIFSHCCIFHNPSRPCVCVSVVAILAISSHCARASTKSQFRTIHFRSESKKKIENYNI